MVRAVDLNADLGEGFGRWTLTDDAGLLEVVTSANVACGFHAGDPPTMRAVCRGAAAAGVAIGAQVSYRDLAGFGRRFLDVEPAELRDEITYQTGALQAFARAAGTRVTYLKPHGALHAATFDHARQAAALVGAVTDCGPGVAVLAAPGSVLLRLAAEAGLGVLTEAFPDRGYQPDGRLVPRGQTGALVSGADEVAARAVRLATEGLVRTVDGSDLRLDPDSLCVHGDSPGALGTARAVRSALAAAGVAVRAAAPA